MKTYALATLGCKVNQCESDEIKGRLAAINNVPFGDGADLYIINSCAVTAEAEAKARQLVARARRAAPDGLVVLTGCWPPAEKERFRGLGVDIFVDHAAKPEIAAHLATAGVTIGAPAARNPSARTRA